LRGTVVWLLAGATVLEVLPFALASGQQIPVDSNVIVGTLPKMECATTSGRTTGRRAALSSGLL
jgi:hypothetical protein